LILPISVSLKSDAAAGFITQAAGSFACLVARTLARPQSTTPDVVARESKPCDLAELWRDGWSGRAAIPDVIFAQF
jgi:hypothetical protein